MSRTVAVIWHTSFVVVAGVLYFFFVLPRWPELLGDTSHTLGTVLRIVVGALIGLAALPVVFTLQRTRKPELGTPQLALTLRTWAIVLHVLAAVLILGAAISEIWLSLDSAGQWLFGIYGAAAAVTLLGVLAFHLAFVAELPPPPPKPLKPKKDKQRRGRRKAAEAEESHSEAEVADGESGAEPADADSSAAAPEESDEPAAEAVESDEPVPVVAEETPTTVTDATEPVDEDVSPGRLRNRRRRRLRGGVAVED